MIRRFDMISNHIQIKMDHIGSYNDIPDDFVKDFTAELIPQYARDVANYFEHQNLNKKLDRVLNISK